MRIDNEIQIQIWPTKMATIMVILVYIKSFLAMKKSLRYYKYLVDNYLLIKINDENCIHFSIIFPAFLTDLDP